MATMPQLILVPQKDNLLASSMPADKVSSTKTEAEKLQKDLETLRNEMQRHLEEKHRDNSEYLPTIRNAIAFLPASTRVEQIPLFGWKQQMEISSAPSFSSVFSMFKRICEFPDSSLLDHLVRLFGSQHMQGKLLTYTDKLRAFRSRTKVSDFTKACTLDSSLPMEFSILTIKLGREWHRSTLEDMEQLRQSMIQKALLTSYGIRLLQVEWDQGLLHWCVPSRALQSLVGSLDSEFLQENHVELLSINGTHLQASGVSMMSTATSVTTSAGSPTSTTSQTKTSTANLLPLSPPSATGGQTGQPLSLQDQLAMAGAQVVQFKPAVGVGTADSKQISSPGVLPHHSSQPTAVQIIHPQAVPSSNGAASGISMSRIAAVPVMQHSGGQQIQILHPQVIQPGSLPGTPVAKHITQTPQVILHGKPVADGKAVTGSTSERKPSLTQDGYMVMQGGPNNSLVLVPNYVMVNSTGSHHKLPPLSSPSLSSPAAIAAASLEKKAVGITSQGIATLLQPGQPVSPLFTAAQVTKGMSVNPILPVTAQASPVFTLAPGQSKVFENPIVSIPNPAVTLPNPTMSSSSSPSPRSVSGMTASDPFDPVTGRHVKSLNHVCGICGNGYMWASSLKRHMHTHMGEGLETPAEMVQPFSDQLHEPPGKKAKPIECQICNQLVESPAAYTRHLRLHMKMHRRKDAARASESSEVRYSEDGGGKTREESVNGALDSEETKEEEEEGEREGEREGETESEGAGEAEAAVVTIKPKREDGAISSSGSEHSSGSASETEEPMETAESAQQPSPSNLPHKNEGLLSQEPSTGVSQDSASLPNAMAISSGGLPFNQLLQYVGQKDSGEGMSDTGFSLESETSQSTTRRFRCDECGRYLSSQAALSGHQQCMHNKQKPHVCHICNKGFFQSHSLTVHLRSHSGEKPYSCIVCNKSFSQRSSLNIHIRTHSGERPYQCPFCSRGFSDSSTLAKHRRTHTGERPYQCRECGASFSQSGNLWRHMKQVHPSAAVTT